MNDSRHRRTPGLRPTWIRRPGWLAVIAALALAACVTYVEDPRPRAVPPPGVEVEIAFFHDWLAPYGDWLLVEPYGWVWTPWGIPAGWHPYTQGRWAYTQHGWTWVSRWVWGWAPFHYGRWTFHRAHGWIWIPARVWGPAWVAWRYGDGWTGWAPLPPSARFEIGTGLSWDRRGVEPHWWSFVETRHLLEPSIHLRLAPRPRALTLLERTRDVTRYEHREGSVIARGLDPEEIGRERGAPIRRVEIREVSSPDARRSRDPQRDEGRDQESEGVDVFRPTVRRPAERPAGEPGDRQPVAVAPRTSEPRPPTARELEQSRRALTAWEQEQRRKLDQIHEIERDAPREATQRRDLEKRQEAEREELREEITRQRRSLESRSDRTSRRPVRRPPKRDDQSSPSVGWVEGREGMRA